MSLTCDVHLLSCCENAENAADRHYWTPKDTEDFWGDSGSSCTSPVAAPIKRSLQQHQQQQQQTDVHDETHEIVWKDDTDDVTEKALKEKNWRSARGGGYKHVPHKDKPPQVVAKRNARERRRVQAVNSAFLRLRRAVPIENSRFDLIQIM